MAVLLRVLIVVVVLGAPGLASAQFGALVHDPLLLAQALQEVAQSLQMVNLATRDLAQWSSLADALATVTDLQEIISDVDAISARLTGRTAFWTSLTEIPATLEVFAKLRRTMTETCRTSAQDGLLAQGIVSRLGPLLQRVQRLVQNLSNLLGTVAGLQAANTVMSEVNGHLSVLTAAVTAANEPKLCELWKTQVEAQALEFLQFEGLRDYGVVPEMP